MEYVFTLAEPVLRADTATMEAVTHIIKSEEKKNTCMTIGPSHAVLTC